MSFDRVSLCSPRWPHPCKSASAQVCGTVSGHLSPFGLKSFLLYELRTPPGCFPLGGWCLKGSVCFLTLDLGRRKQQVVPRGQNRNPDRGFKMDDHRGQHKASALTLAALQVRGWGLGPVTGLSIFIPTRFLIWPQFPHLATGGMAAEGWFVRSIVCF